jgi:hypothetical protein
MSYLLLLTFASGLSVEISGFFLFFPNTVGNQHCQTVGKGFVWGKKKSSHYPNSEMLH